MNAPFEWDASLASGATAVDAQHRALLAQCARLADPEGFDATYAQLLQDVRQHLAQGADADEREEFEAVVEEVATTEHFDRAELQRFLSLWCWGHVKACAARHRGEVA